MMGKRLPEIFDDMRLAILGRKKDHSWSESGKDAYEATVGGVKNLTGDTLSKTAQRFNDALPYIQRAGYEVTQVEVGLGLSPKIVPRLKMRELLGEEEQAALLEEVRDQKLVSTIISTLFKASAARSKLKFKSFHFTEIELELSILPSVILKFKPDRNAIAAAPAELTFDEKDTPES